DLIADGTFFYALREGEPHVLASLFSPNTPGYVRGATAVGVDEFLVATSDGNISRYRHGGEPETEVIAAGFDQLYGIAATADRSIVAVESGPGRVLSIRGGQTEILAAGLHSPTGVAFGPDGQILVSETGAGRVVSVAAGGVDTVVDGLETPHGILVRGSRLLIVDSGLKQLIAVDLTTKARRTLAAELPVGVPEGVVAKPLRGTPPFSGPMGPFAGIAAGPDGTVYVSADAEGSVLAVRIEG